MCGICGRLDFRLARHFDEQEMLRLASVMTHRGPDDAGAFVRPGVGLAMRRLSIIDLAGGHQPIGNEDGTVQVILNGEIYNHEQLRRELQAKGHSFRTRSDTEVIAHLWEDLQEGAFSRLRGMFAVAIWDERRNELVLARDRLGIKPLYVCERPDALDFASELKVLLALPETSRDLHPGALAGYFLIGYIPPPETAWRGIRELPPGHWLRWRPGAGLRTGAYWTLDFAPDEAVTEAGWLERLDAALDDAVRSHLVSDVPVAAFLSGGLDSGAVVSDMAGAMQSPPRAYTVRYTGSGSEAADETSLAALVAARYGAEHVVVDVTPNAAQLLDDIVGAFDQPMADNSAMPTYLLTQAVARDVKVALSGLGGDELFGGYERHSGLQVSQRLERLPAGVMPLLSGLLRAGIKLRGSNGLAADRVDRFLRSSRLSPEARYLGFVSRMAWGDLQGILGAAAAGALQEEALVARLTRHFGSDRNAPILNRGLQMDYGQYLPGDILPLTDRLSMLHSLEVRVPFVDHELVELAARIPPRFKVRGLRKKIILRKLLKSRLPAELFSAPKRGFVGPTGSWLRHELREMLLDTITSASLRESGWIAPAVAERLAREHLASTSDRHAVALWSLLVFARWHQRYVSSPVASAA